jgi:hypothetical protein
MSRADVLQAFGARKTKKVSKVEFTHNELVLRACQWLRARGCKVVMAEPGLLHNMSPDALGWESLKETHQIECKISRADFKADSEKRHKTWRDEHQLGLFRWFMTPRGLVQPSELPQGWGLLEVTGQKVFVVVRAAKLKHDEHTELGMLFRALSRVQEEHFHEAYVNPEAFTQAKIWTVAQREEPFDLYPAEDVELHGLVDLGPSSYRKTYMGRVAGSSSANLYKALYEHRGMIAEALTEAELLQVIGTTDAMVKFVNEKLRTFKKMGAHAREDLDACSK